MSLELLIKAVIAVASALLGAILTFSIKVNHNKLCTLISISAGALFSAALFVIVPETSKHLQYYEILLFVLFGYLFFSGISKFVAHLCPACSASHFDDKTTHRFSETAIVMMSVLSLHSFMDGVAISSGEFVEAFHHSIFAAVMTHKFPEGLALVSLLLSSGQGKRRIFITVLLIESTTILGGFLGEYLFAEIIDVKIFSMLQASIAGGFLFLASHAVFGEVFMNHKKLVSISFLSGVILILLLNFLFH